MNEFVFVSQDDGAMRLKSRENVKQSHKLVAANGCIEEPSNEGGADVTEEKEED